MQNNNLKELIKIIEDKATISEVISDYISLEKKGNNYIGLCPFHPDTKPSMSVSDSKGIFKCFSCGKGGSVISFVQLHEGISFIESLKKLSNKYKIDWTKYLSTYSIKRDINVDRGIEISNDALDFFKFNLKNNNSSKVKSYLEKRGITKEIIEKFNIGLSGDGKSLVNFLKLKKYSEEEIIKYGLGRRSEDSLIHDYFINRLMFSIYDSNGEIVGFSGRVFDNDKYAKYLNSPETPTFKKSNILYNLHNAKSEASLKKELIIVEGYMDVIALYKLGFKNSIATMGTALTRNHINAIKKISNNILLGFDSDVAGINATLSIGKELLKNNFNVNVIELDGVKDLDELLSKSKSKISKTLNSKVLFYEFYKKNTLSKFKKIDKNNINLIKELISIISFEKEDLIRENNINNLAKELNIDVEVILDEIDNNLNNSKKTKQSKSENQIKKFPKEIITTEFLIINYASLNDEAFNFLSKNPIPIHNPELLEFWIIYKNYKMNNLPIDSKIKNEINKLNEKVISINKESEIMEIQNMQSFKQHIEKVRRLFNKLNRDQIYHESMTIKNEKEKKELFLLLRNLTKK
ncbi:MAG: DNA primase [Candidatus Tyloplasma litorale]|nr:MAG: DNA primase [Mycoplasmatales bacterium]